MKDYTKYDFAAIVGAEVSVIIKRQVGYEGTLKFVDEKNGGIFLLVDDDPLQGRWLVIEDITPGSLTAKIKVEDMSLKQLHSYYKSLAKRDEYGDYVVVIRGGEVEEPSRRITYSFQRTGDDGDVEEYGQWTNDSDEPLDDYIDCTDWGWRHE